MSELRPEIEGGLDSEDYLNLIICIIGFIILATLTLQGTFNFDIHPGILIVCTVGLLIASAMRLTLLGVFAIPVVILFRKPTILPNLLILLAVS